MKKCCQFLRLLLLSGALFAIFALWAAADTTPDAEKVKACAFYTISDSGDIEYTLRSTVAAQDTERTRGKALWTEMSRPDRKGNRFVLCSNVALAGTETEALLLSRDTWLDLNGHKLYILSADGFTITDGTLSVYSGVPGAVVSHGILSGAGQENVDYAKTLFTAKGNGKIQLGTSTENAPISENMTVLGGAVLDAQSPGNEIGGGIYYQILRSKYSVHIGEGASVRIANATFYTAQRDVCVAYADAGAQSATAENSRFYSVYRTCVLFDGKADMDVAVRDCTLLGIPLRRALGQNKTIRVTYTGEMSFNYYDADEIHTYTGAEKPAYTDPYKTVRFTISGETYEEKLNGILTDADVVRILWEGEKSPELWVVGATPFSYVNVHPRVEGGYFYRYLSSETAFTDEEGKDLGTLGALDAQYAGKTLYGKSTVHYEKIRISFSMLDDHGTLSYAVWHENAAERGKMLSSALGALYYNTDFVLWDDVAISVSQQIWVTKGFSLDFNGYTFLDLSSGNITMHTDNQGFSSTQHIWFYSSRPGGMLKRSSDKFFISIDPPYQVHFGAYNDQYRDNLTIHSSRLVQGWGAGFLVDGGTYCSTNGFPVFAMANRPALSSDVQFCNATVILAHGGSMFSCEKNLSFTMENMRIISLSGTPNLGIDPQKLNYYGGAFVMVTLRDCIFLNCHLTQANGDYDTAIRYVYEGNCRFGTNENVLPLFTSYIVTNIPTQDIRVQDPESGEEITMTLRYCILTADTPVATVTWEFAGKPLVSEKWIIGSVPVCSLSPAPGYRFVYNGTEALSADAVLEVELECDHPYVKMQISVRGLCFDVTFYVQREEVLSGVKIGDKVQKFPKAVYLDAQDETLYYPFVHKGLSAKELAKTVWDLEITLSLTGESVVRNVGNITLATYTKGFFAQDSATTAPYKDLFAAVCRYTVLSAENAQSAPVLAIRTSLEAAGLTMDIAPIQSPAVQAALAKENAIENITFALRSYGGFAVEVAADYEGILLITYRTADGKTVGKIFREDSDYVTVDGKRYARLMPPSAHAAGDFTVLATASGTYKRAEFTIGADSWVATFTNKSEANTAAAALLHRIADFGAAKTAARP